MIPERRLQTQEQAPAARPASRKAPHVGRYVVRLVFTVVVALLAVSRFAVAAQAGYQLDALQGKLAVATANTASLQGQVAALTSAQSLVAEAPKLKLAPASTVFAVSVPSVPGATAPAQPAKAHGGGFLAAIGALIQAIANEVARI